MTKTTTEFGLPYPEDSDVPNGPAEIQSLAEKVDEILARSGGRAKKSIINTEQEREGTGYGTMPTPDRVTGLVLPTDGLIIVGFSALMTLANSASGGNMLIAPFLGENQVKAANPTLAAPTVIEASQNVNAANIGKWSPCTSYQHGLWLRSTQSETSAEAPVTTGQLVGVALEAGGFFAIFAEAGTYEFSLRVKTSGTLENKGKVKMKNRKLWVWVQGFA